MIAWIVGSTVSPGAGALVGGLPVEPVPEGGCSAEDQSGGLLGQSAACAFSCEDLHLLTVEVDADDEGATVSGTGKCGGAEAHCSDDNVGYCTDTGGPTDHDDPAGSCSGDTDEFWDSGLYVACSTELAQTPELFPWCPVVEPIAVCVDPLPVLGGSGCDDPWNLCGAVVCPGPSDGQVCATFPEGIGDPCDWATALCSGPGGGIPDPCHGPCKPPELPDLPPVPCGPFCEGPGDPCGEGCGGPGLPDPCHGNCVPDLPGIPKLPKVPEVGEPAPPKPPPCVVACDGVPLPDVPRCVAGVCGWKDACRLGAGETVADASASVLGICAALDCRLLTQQLACADGLGVPPDVPGLPGNQQATAPRPDMSRGASSVHIYMGHGFALGLSCHGLVCRPVDPTCVESADRTRLRCGTGPGVREAEVTPPKVH